MADEALSSSAVARRFYLQRLAVSLMPRERLSMCVWSVLPSAPSVDVLHFPQRRSARYRGVMYCGSAWLCPVCSSIIAERRRDELSRGVESWRSGGGYVSLLTLTLSHTREDRLSLLLDSLSAAWHDAVRRRQWRLWSDRVGLLGSVRSLEITHGASGWHPHFHVLLFTRRPALSEAGWLRNYWLDRLARVGRDASWFRGADLRAADDAVTGYVAKLSPHWTAVDEVSRAIRKRGRGDSRGYLQLLADAESDCRSRALLYEYAAAVHGRSWLRWSRGLRQALGLGDEVADEELVYQVSERVVQVLARLDRAAWRAVCANDIRSEVLECASSGDSDALNALLASFGISALSCCGGADDAAVA